MKKEKIITVIITAVIFLFGLIPNANSGLFKGKIEKANCLANQGNELLTMKRPDLAREKFAKADKLLGQAITENPKDPKTHYESAIVYTNLGNMREAENRFATIKDILKSPKYCEKIGKFYMEFGFSKLGNNKANEAFYSFRKAVLYNPGLKPKIARSLYDQGKSLMSACMPSMARAIFKETIFFDQSFGQDISNLYLIAGSAAKKEDKIDLYLTALEFSAKYKKAIIAEISKTVKTLGLKKNQLSYYEKIFRRYLNEKELEKARLKKTWKTVYEKPFVGIGYTDGEYGGGGISIAESGKDCRFGDKITIKGKNFEVWDYGKWNPHSENFSFINVIKAPGKKTGARAPEGTPFKVKIERLL